MPDQNIIEWEIEKGRKPIMVRECANVSESAPPGFYALVTFTQIRVVTQEMANAILQVGAGKSGLPKAASYLFDATGGHAAIGQCVAVVKEIKAKPMISSTKDAPKIVLKNLIWMTKEDWEKYKKLPHIEAVDPKLRDEQTPPIESVIEWPNPETYHGGLLDPEGDIVNVEKPPADKMARQTGQITTISSAPTPNRSGGIQRK